MMQDVSEHFRGGGFGLFAGMLEEPKNAVWAMPAPGGGSRAFCDRMNAWAQGEGQPGLGYIFWREGEEGGAGPDRAQHRPRARRGDPRAAGPGGRRRGLLRRRRSRRSSTSSPALARTKVGTELKLIDEDRFEFCWIVDFPMYEFNEETNHVDFSHNPFSMPQGELEALKTKDPLEILAYQYDIVCNGVELCSRRGAEPPARDHGQGVRDRRLSGRARSSGSSAAC